MLIQLLLGVLLAGCLISAILPLVRGRRLAQASATWPTVRGQVVVVGAHAGAWSDLPRIEYAYRVGGATYHASALAFGLPRDTTALRAMTQARVGDGVTIAYCPDDPALAVLFPGGSATRKLLGEWPVLLNLLFSGALSILFVFFILRDLLG